MQTISLDDISRDPNEFLRRVEAGEEFVLMRDAQPVAEVKSVPTACFASRPFGLCAGEFTVPDDFDSPLPAEVIEDFEGR